MTTASPAGSLRVAYLISQYPALSHAFIETEIGALRELGVDIHTFSIRPPDVDELLTDRSHREAADTTVLLEDAGPRFLRGTTALLARAPRALLTVLALALRSGVPTSRARLWQLFYLAEAVVLWWHMSRRGLRHIHVHFANNGADVARLTVALGTAVDGPGHWRWSMSMHGPTEFEDQRNYDLGAKVASASVTACISDYCRSQLMRLLPPSEWSRLAVVRMAVDTDRFSPGPRASFAGAGEAESGSVPLTVVTVGRLVPEKGAPVLLQAISQLADAGTPVRLIVVGTGPLADELQAQSRALGVADLVEFRGPVGQQELPDIYRNSDVFCLPSFAEGLPVVLMEAMACGRPVVSTTIAAIPELVTDHVTGLLVLPGRPDLLAAALTELANRPELRQLLGDQARDAVLRDHDRQDNARRLLDLWGRSAPRGHGRP